jgi:hypothetical protein
LLGFREGREIRGARYFAGELKFPAWVSHEEAQEAQKAQEGQEA